MAKTPVKSALTTRAHTDVRTITVPICLSPADAQLPRERIDVVPQFIDFKLAALTDAQLVDSLGLVKRAKKDLEKWEKLAIDVVKAKANLPEVGGETIMHGDKCKAVITCTEPRRLSMEKLIEKYGEADLDDCYVSPAQYTLTIKPNV